MFSKKKTESKPEIKKEPEKPVDKRPIKHKGLCPFCSNIVDARIEESNTFRRDKCQCPECKNYIYVCRTLGCTNYAKGGDYWDDELCPSCASSVTSAVGTIATGILTILINNKIDKK